MLQERDKGKGLRLIGEEVLKIESVTATDYGIPHG